ncbi:MAG: T9SS type A sorting domain-containing protein, partial [Candidatus Cloacimonetes bacterium]|nr:T9SS type A sorting domain-containing protein [Candidatus Cloacimonadota bacterium]
QLEILNTPIETVTSNEQGEYFFPEIPVGVYEILITALNYTATVEEISLSEGDNVLDFELVICEAESFEYGVFDEIWSFGGNADWTIDTESYHGYYSARSGIIGSNQTSSLIIELDVLSDDVISFFKKVSCEDDDENDYDYLAFYIDGVEQSRWDGETDWTEEIFSVSSGIHTFEWKYLKDGSVSQGSDCAWIDYIFFPETSGTDTDDNQVAMNSYILSNYPNPFNPSTVIEFYLKTEGKIILNIYNLKGQFVKNLKNDFTEPGYHTILWDGTDNSGKDVCSGLYFGKLRTSNYTSIIKMILMK